MAGLPPPHDLEAERAVISAALFYPDALIEAATLLKPQDFYAPKHAGMWEAALALSNADQAVDQVSVAGWLRERSKSVSYADVAEVVDLTPAVMHVAEHARKVLELAVRRRAIEACSTIIGEARGGIDDFDDWRARVQTRLSDSLEGYAEDSFCMLEDAVSSLVEKFEAGTELMPALPTGIGQLDALTRGVRLGKVTVLGARPGVGKTAFAIQLARSFAHRGNATHLIEIEMEREEVAFRALVQAAQVDSGVLLANRPEDRALIDGWAPRIQYAKRRIAGLPFSIDDRADQTTASLRLSVLRAMRDFAAQGKRLRVVVVDYLQFVDPETKKGESLTQAIGRVSRALATMAKRYGFAVVLLSQLNREGEKDDTPRMSHFRESGNIEQDAYCLMIMQRGRSNDPSEVEIHVLKVRDGGRTGIARCRFDGPTLTFSDPDAPAPVDRADDFDESFTAGF